MWIYTQYVPLNFYCIMKMKGHDYMIDFSPLWETMKDKKISQYRLLQAGIDNKTLDALKKNNNITLLTLEKLCKILKCTPNDVVRFTEN